MANYFFIATLAILGAIIVKEDISEGKIRNKWIKIGLMMGALGYLTIFLGSVAEHFGIFPKSVSIYPLGYFLDVSINFSASILASYLFWQYKLWSAGDAKFFILSSLLLPLEFYSNGLLPYFPSSALLINIFLPISLFLILKIILEIAVNFRKFIASEAGFIEEHWSKIKLEISSFWNHKRRILIFGGTFLLTFLFIPLVKYQTILMLPSNFGVMFSVFLIFYFLQSYTSEMLEIFLKKKWFLPSMFLFVVSYFILGLLYFSDLLIFALVVTIEIGTVFLVALTVFDRLSNFYIGQKEVTAVGIKDLRSRMVISEEFVKNIQGDKELKSRLGDLYPEGLTEEQVGVLKKWFLENNQFKVVPVYKTFSFAPYIFIGVIVTMLLKQSLLHLFLAYIR